jgi:hypothetical protein
VQFDAEVDELIQKETDDRIPFDMKEPTPVRR